MTNLGSILKSRDITLPTEDHLVKAMVFPVVMYGCESWTIEKAECQRIDAFELWCWRRLLTVSWTARRSNQSILKEISPGCSLEGLILKLKLQYSATWCEELTHLKRPWCWGGLGAEGEGDDRGWDGWMASPTQWTWVWVNFGSWWWTGRPGVLRFMGSQRMGHDWGTELNWTDITTWCPRKIVLAWHSQLWHNTDACSCQFEWWQMFCFRFLVWFIWFLSWISFCMFIGLLNFCLFNCLVTNVIHFSIGVLVLSLYILRKIFKINFSLFILVILTLFVVQILVSLTLTLVF